MQKGKRIQAVWLSVSSLPVPRSQQLVDKPSLTTGGFPAGPPSCLTPSLSSVQGLPGYPSLIQTQQGHTKELLKLPPAKSTGDKIAPPREQR